LTNRLRKVPTLAETSVQRKTGALSRILRPGVALLACTLVLLLFHGVSSGIDYHAMLKAVRDTPPRLIAWSVLLTSLSYFALIARERVALICVGATIPSSAVMFTSFCASALGNAFGSGKLTGRSVRDRVYGAVGVHPEQIVRVTFLMGTSFVVGLFAFAALGMTAGGRSLALLLRLSQGRIHAVALAMLLAAAAALIALLRRVAAVAIGELRIELPSLRRMSFLALLVIVDELCGATALWCLLPSGAVDFGSFAAVFAAATALGLVSRIPGGLGVFEAVIIFALGRSLPPDRVAASLLIYRGVYFLLPLSIAATSLAGFELKRPTAAPVNKPSERLLLGVGLLSPVFLSVATFSVGVMLIVSGATPAVDWRLAALQEVLPLWAVEISHLLATLGGVFLLFVARGLYHRLDGAWWLALIVALANVVFSLAKGLAFGETAAILFLTFLLLATRRQFTRPAAFLRQPFTITWFFTIAVVIAAAIGILLFAFRDVAYRHEIWWQFEFDAQASRALRAMLGASIFALMISLWQFLRASPGRVLPPSSDDLVRAADIIRRQERSGAVLGLMGDKSFIFSSTGSTFLMYARRGHTWIALFDPIGPCREWPELVWRFVELADAHGGRAAFYQICPEGLAVYLDSGLRVVKIGEEAVIDLKSFALEGAQRYGLRQALKRAGRDRVTSEIWRPNGDHERERALKDVSQAWLAARRASERRFSVAAFEPRFLEAQSVILARRDDIPVAFATVMTTDSRSEGTVGLMRQVPEAPPYTMEFLLTQLAIELKAEGFSRLSLGMAPLAGLVWTPLSSNWHVLAGMLWEHGRAIYNFQGLRVFKNKFHPTWEPRYLAASGTFGPFVSMADVAVLVSGHAR
jgi:phosphatidylglycerol lysyltransferase